MTLNLHPSVPARPAAGRRMVTSDAASKQVRKTLDSIRYTTATHLSGIISQSLSCLHKWDEKYKLTGWGKTCKPLDPTILKYIRYGASHSSCPSARHLYRTASLHPTGIQWQLPHGRVRKKTGAAYYIVLFHSPTNTMRCQEQTNRIDDLIKQNIKFSNEIWRNVLPRLQNTMHTQSRQFWQWNIHRGWWKRQQLHKRDLDVT